MCLIAYAGFLRFSELINLKRSNICIFDSHVSLFIERSKTDVYKEGSTVVISRTPNDTCPVAMLEKYLRKANIMPSSEEFIFRSILYCKKSKSYQLRNGNKPLSYTRAREILLDALKSLGLESGNFGLHSLRSGVLQLLLATALLIDCLRNMVDGNPRKQKMAMFRKIY